MAAEAATLTTDPKQLGKQLRAVRRRKGLSLSEVARGAGLSRRELVAYERGKVEIPESDLWVLAGSCGVDVSELVPEREVHELVAGPSTIGDSIAFLRAGQAVNGSGRALRAIEAPDEPRAPYSAPRPVATPIVDSPIDPGGDATAPVDVFEELARLPEPVPLRPDPDDMPDLLATPEFVVGDNPIAPHDPATPPAPAAPPEPAVPVALADPVVPSEAPEPPVADGPPPGTYALVDGPPPGTYELVDDVQFELAPDAPTVVEMPAPEPVEQPWTPADAPPIDVALLGETFTEPLDRDIEEHVDPFTVFEQGSVTPAWASSWQPQQQPEPGWATATGGVWDEPDPAAMVNATAPVELVSIATVEDLPLSPHAPSGWTHQPDPEATSTGFLVDWGDQEPYFPAPTGGGDSGIDDADAIVEFGTTDDTDEAAEIDAPVESGITEETGTDASPDAPVPDLLAKPDDASPETLDAPARAIEPTWDTERAIENHIDAPERELSTAPEWNELDDRVPASAPEPDNSGFERISWRPEPIDTVAVVTTAEVGAVLLAEPITTPASTLSEIPDEAWSVAGEDWELGNALPLVEVRGQGALVMRRADERWALADLTLAPTAVVEVDLEFRSGPGFGVLFRAAIDDFGRMSGYSFDIDPVYEGGAFLIRQWQGDRELWNPIAHVVAPDVDTMHGHLTVRLELAGERLVALVNGEAVMVVDDLRQGSLDRGREAPGGDRVGVQAWSSSDLVIETLRVAAR
jgi:transcriptional regulator with XRE-family HTH domain